MTSAVGVFSSQESKSVYPSIFSSVQLISISQSHYITSFFAIIQDEQAAIGCTYTYSNQQWCRRPKQSSQSRTGLSAQPLQDILAMISNAMSNIQLQIPETPVDAPTPAAVWSIASDIIKSRV